MKEKNSGLERFKTPEAKESGPRIAKLSIVDFAQEIGLKPDSQGRFIFGPEHNQLAYEYAEKFARDKKAEAIIIDGPASPGVIASLLHGAHPAEGYLSYVFKNEEGETIETKVKILEPLPKGEGEGPEGFTWVKKENPTYTLVEFALASNFKIEDLNQVIPPEVNPSKPVIISGRGPLYLTQTIAASYRHYKGVPAVGFYQPAGKFGPAKTEIGISHSEEFPLGLNFGEPSEINIAKEQYEKMIKDGLAEIKEGFDNQKIVAIETKGKIIKITLNDGKTYTLFVRAISKSE